MKSTTFAVIFTIATTTTAAHAMDYTNGYALQLENGTHVGFVLGSPSFKAEAGDCVFMLLPQKADAAGSALGIAISELKVTGEHAWRKRAGAILVVDGHRTLLTISASGEVSNAKGVILGNAIAIPEQE